MPALAKCPVLPCLRPALCRVVITQMQALHKHKQGLSTYAVARHVYHDHGLSGFFKGLGPSLVMVVNPTIQYIIYEGLVGRMLDIRCVWGGCGKVSEARRAWKGVGRSGGRHLGGGVTCCVSGRCSQRGCDIAQHALCTTRDMFGVCLYGSDLLANARSCGCTLC